MNQLFTLNHAAPDLRTSFVLATGISCMTEHSSMPVKGDDDFENTRPCSNTVLK